MKTLVLKIKQVLSAIKGSRKVQFFLGIVFFLLIFLILFFSLDKKDKRTIFENFFPEEKEEAQNKKGDFDVSLLDGTRVSQAETNLRPYGITIENHPDARPQSGLDKASLVIEALAEGGIPRFLAFFNQDVAVAEIGPVRSARTYYLDWVSEIRPVYVHYGGETLTISQIPKYGILDINGMYLSGQYFWRANYSPAPHNAYTSSDRLAKVWEAFDWDKTADFTAWEFKDDNPAIEGEIIEEIVYQFSPSYLFNVEYEYDSVSNDYLRSQAGKEHTDRVTQEQYRAKNVVVQKTRYGIRDKEGHMGVETIGGGKAFVFLDGKVIEGFWRKNSREERTFFYDQDWQPIKFNRGATWVAVLPEEQGVEYK